MDRRRDRRHERALRTAVTLGLKVALGIAAFWGFCDLFGVSSAPEHRAAHPAYGVRSDRTSGGTTSAAPPRPQAPDEPADSAEPYKPVEDPTRVTR